MSLLIPQDDRPLEEFTSDDHTCSFDPYDDSDSPGEESWHFLRRCSKCGTTWYSLHCRCEWPDVSLRCPNKEQHRRFVFNLVWWEDLPDGGRILADDGFGNLISGNWNITVYFHGAADEI